MNNYIKASLFSIPAWYVTGCVFNGVAEALGMYRPAEAGMVWANLAGITSFLYFSKTLAMEEKTEDADLNHRRRIYNLDMEETFRKMQLAMTEGFAMSNRWELSVNDMSTGYLQYAIRWEGAFARELGTRQRQLGQVNIYCQDVSDQAGAKTEVTYIFSTNAGFTIFRNEFREIVKQTIARLDENLPEHMKVKMTKEEALFYNTPYTTTNGD